MTISRRQFAGALSAAAMHTEYLHGAGNRAARIDNVLRSGIAQRKIPAAVAMLANGNKILYSGAFGTRDTSGAPVTDDSIFSIASMTKAITTTAALQLVEQGKI